MDAKFSIPFTSAIMMMRGNVTIHDTQSDFDKWEREARDAQNLSQLTVAAGPQGSSTRP